MSNSLYESIRIAREIMEYREVDGLSGYAGRNGWSSGDSKATERLEATEQLHGLWIYRVRPTGPVEVALYTKAHLSTVFPVLVLEQIAKVGRPKDNTLKLLPAATNAEFADKLSRNRWGWDNFGTDWSAFEQTRGGTVDEHFKAFCDERGISDLKDLEERDPDDTDREFRQGRALGLRERRRELSEARIIFQTLQRVGNRIEAWEEYKKILLQRSQDNHAGQVKLARTQHRRLKADPRYKRERRDWREEE